MMSEPLPSGWHSAPSEARRWIRALLLVHLLSPRGSSCFSCYCPSLSFRPFHHHRHLLLRLFHFILFRSPPHSFSYRAAASPVLRTATRANIHHGVVTGPRSHGGWILSSCFSIPRNYHGATMGVQPAGSASSAVYVLAANDPRAASVPLFLWIPTACPLSFAFCCFNYRQSEPSERIGRTKVRRTVKRGSL